MIRKLNSYWYQSTFFTLLQRSSIVLFGLTSYLILVRVLSESQMGIWALFLAIGTTFEMTKYALLKNGLITIFHTAKGNDEKSDVVSSSLLLNIGFTGIFIILILISSGFLSRYWETPALKPMLSWYILTSIALIPFSHYEYLQQANMEFKGVFAAYFIRQGSFFLGVLILVLLPEKSTSLNLLAILQSISVAIGSIISYLYCRKLIMHTFKPRLKWISSLLNYGKYAFGSGACANIFGSMDRYMSASLLNSATVAYYDVSARINNMIDIPTAATADVIFPQSARATIEEGTGKVKYMYERMAGILVGLILPISIITFIFAPWVITLISGRKYLASIPIIRISMIYAILRPIQIQGANILNSINKPNITFYLNICILITNLLLNYVYIKQFGFLGAAYGTLLSTLFSTAITFYLVHRAIKANFFNIFIYTKQFYFQLLNKIYSMVTGRFNKPVS